MTTPDPDKTRSIPLAVAATGFIPYDLQPSQRPFPWEGVERSMPTRPSAATIDRRNRERQARVKQETVQPLARWRQVRDVLDDAGNTVGVAVLDLHQPQAGYDKVVCSTCMTDECYEATAEEWECGTFVVVAEAVAALDD